MNDLSRMTTLGGVVAIGAFIVTACGGHESSTQVALPGRNAAVPLQRPGLPEPRPTVTPSPPGGLCSFQKLPGTYTTIVVSGEYSPRTQTFTAFTGHRQSAYEINTFATPTPVPSNTPTPHGTPTALHQPQPPTPTPVAQFGWTGSYSVAGGPAPIRRGCFFLVVTKPAPSKPWIGSASGSPFFPPGTAYTITFLRGGRIRSLIITDLSKADGHGTFSLDDGASGTITLGPRSPSG